MSERSKRALERRKRTEKTNEAPKTRTPKTVRRLESEPGASTVDDIVDTTNVRSLTGRNEEFEQLHAWISESIQSNEPLSVYISGKPGTGKTATITKISESFKNKVKYIFVNCASGCTKTTLFKKVFEEMNCEKRVTQNSFECLLKELKTPLLLVLDEIDHLLTRSNSFLYSTFQWPYTISSKIIVIGIANSIDLTERNLPKLMLTNPPKRLVFKPYDKNTITKILKERLTDENVVNEKAVELCARKVSAMSGDLRTALHILRQTKHTLMKESEKEETDKPKPNGCREVLGVLNTVYSSPLSRARLPLQPRILLAVCLALSYSKKNAFNRANLTDAYIKTCEAIRAPTMDDEDIMVAFQTLVSQSFVRQLNDGKLILQVDRETAKSAISDNSILDQIAILNL